MQHSEARQRIETMRIRWKTGMLLALAVWAVSIAFLFTVLLHVLFHASLYCMVLLAPGLFAGLLFFNRGWRITTQETARFLDKTEPSLEESTLLLLTAPSGLLQTLQAARTAEMVVSLKDPKPWARRLRNALFALGGSLVAGLLVLLFAPGNTTGTEKAVRTVEAGKKPEGVSSVLVRVEPPAYTNQPVRELKQFGITVEENSLVQWQVSTAQAAGQLYLLFNDSVRLPMQPDASHRQWTFRKQITHTGFYQLVLDSLASELYRIEMIPDESPSIVVHKPTPNSVIDYGMPPRTGLSATVSDDYGISDARVLATIASGSGEGVKFREAELRFAEQFTGNGKQYSLQRSIDLAALGMIPGDELYFYLLAKDNAGHEKRSDILIVTIADTAQLMTLSGLQMGVNVKPDYFRSQRQIIIETEQLLREKDTISTERFNERSNNLGIDQKLLRLRYGKFLGEENNMGGEGEEHDDDHQDGGVASDATDFGNADKILDAFTHKHDISEDASFFSAETKKQLKATLAEMWNAELQLRMFRPREALPYEYKALRLLKELQQKDRVYVAKTSVKTTPLKPEKRLTADLGKIQEPSWQKAITLPRQEQDQLLGAMAELEQMRAAPYAFFSPSMATAYRFISNAAAQAPAAYLQALSAIKRLQQLAAKKQRASGADLEQIQQALQRLIKAASPLPLQRRSSLQQTGEIYFKQLQQQKANERP